MERDPVCGMLVDPKTAAGAREFEGQRYYFCNPACLTKFQQAPQRYVGAQPTRPGPEERGS